MCIFEHPAWSAITGMLLVVVNILLVIVTWHLMKAAKGQTAFLERQEKRQVRISYTSIGGSGAATRFEGIGITNIGIPTITITDVHIAKGIPVSEPYGSISISLDKVDEHNGKQLSNFQPPHRLQTGDRIAVLYNLEDLVSHLAPGERIRYECMDSFGDTYVSAWVDYHKATRTISVHDYPGEGLRSPTHPTNPIRA